MKTHRFKFLVPALLCFLFYSSTAVGQNEKPKLYDEEINANMQIEEAIKQAEAEGKHVFLQVGGNWCSWCIKFHTYISEDAGLDSILQANYVVKKINYSRTNANPEAMEMLEYPQRFGFPVFVILDEKGNRLHTQDSGYLEKDEWYDRGKVERFFLNWRKEAFDAELYRVK